MPATRLASTAIDRVSQVREAVADEIAAFETSLQERVKRECKGVVTACVRPSVEGYKFKLLIVDEATLFARAPANVPASKPGFGRELFGWMRAGVGAADAGASVFG